MMANIQNSDVDSVPDPHYTVGYLLDPDLHHHGGRGTEFRTQKSLKICQKNVRLRKKIILRKVAGKKSNSFHVNFALKLSSFMLMFYSLVRIRIWIRKEADADPHHRLQTWFFYVSLTIV